MTDRGRTHRYRRHDGAACPRHRAACRGDVVYNGVHPYLTESGGVIGVDFWLAALDLAEALRPAIVIAGHKEPRSFDTPADIQATRRYLTDARQLLESSISAEVFYEEMLGRHRNRINPGALWGAAMTLLPPD